MYLNFKFQVWLVVLNKCVVGWSYMNIIIGKYAGFCPGVLNSVDKAQEALSQYKNIYCLGEIIHNKLVVDDLKEKGMKIVQDINDIPNSCVVIFRAHGVKKSIYEIAKKKKLKIIDLTCPIVKSIHDKVEKLKKDQFIIIIGDKNHPENIGTKDFAGINSIIINDNSEIEEAFNEFKRSGLNKINVISQTTYNLKKFNCLKESLKEKFKNYEINVDNTICKTTELRQREVDSLSKIVDVVIVIGGKNSSNTQKLYEISSKNAKKVNYIEEKEELKNEKFYSNDTIAIVAGASTPKNVILDVKGYLDSI